MSSNEHECINFSTQDYHTGEMVCIKCGKVLKDGDGRDNFVADEEGRALNAENYYVGNPLLNTETENMDYVSKGNTGLAYKLNNRRAKDFQGKKINTRLNDSYKSGNIAGGKGMTIKVDPLTGETKIKFNMYEKPMLAIVKERANTELSRYTLHTADRVVVAKEIKKIVSRLHFSEMVDYTWIAATLNAQVLKKKDSEQLEERLNELRGKIRLKIVSRCDPKRAAEFNESLLQAPIPVHK